MQILVNYFEVKFAKIAQNVSQLGISFSIRKKSSLVLPNAAISIKLSAPQIAAHKATKYFPAEDKASLPFAANYSASKKISIEKEK